MALAQAWSSEANTAQASLLGEVWPFSVPWVALAGYLHRLLTDMDVDIA